MKKVVIVVALLLVAVATLPWWGGCGLNAQACKAWCSVRHLNSDAARVGCEARCVADKLGCLAQQGANGANDFMSGLKGK